MTRDDLELNFIAVPPPGFSVCFSDPQVTPQLSFFPRPKPLRLLTFAV